MGLPAGRGMAWGSSATSPCTDFIGEKSEKYRTLHLILRPGAAEGSSGQRAREKANQHTGPRRGTKFLIVASVRHWSRSRKTPARRPDPRTRARCRVCLTIFEPFAVQPGSRPVPGGSSDGIHPLALGNTVRVCFVPLPEETVLETRSAVAAFPGGANVQPPRSPHGLRVLSTAMEGQLPRGGPRVWSLLDVAVPEERPVFTETLLSHGTTYNVPFLSACSD